MIAEAFGVPADRFGEQPQVVVQAFDDHIEVTMQPLFALAKVLKRCELAKVVARCELAKVVARCELAKVVARCESTLESAKSGVHRSFEL